MNMEKTGGVVPIVRGVPARASILRKSIVRRVKEIPPPVIPDHRHPEDEAYNRLSNLSLGSSSGFGSGSSQESTASSDSASSSTLSSFAGPTTGMVPASRATSNSPAKREPPLIGSGYSAVVIGPRHPHPSVHFQLPSPGNPSSPSPPPLLLLGGGGGGAGSDAAARKARMNLRLNFIPDNLPLPPGGAFQPVNKGSYDNLHGGSTGRFNQPRSPITGTFSPLASPLFQPGKSDV